MADVLNIVNLTNDNLDKLAQETARLRQEEFKVTRGESLRWLALNQILTEVQVEMNKRATLLKNTIIAEILGL